MGRYITTLSVVNFTGKNITQSQVRDLDAYDWDYDPPTRTEPFRPDLNFQKPIDDLDARCEREDINSAAKSGSNFTLSLDFDDQTWLRLQINQRDALYKLIGPYAADKSAANSGLEVLRVTGQDHYTYSNGFYIRPSIPPDNSHWMKDLLADKPDVKLNEMTMPGSHDAGMYVDNSSQVTLHAAKEGGGDWALTQNLDFLQQLKAGVRYFDLRVYYDKAQILWAYHGQWKGSIFYGGFGGKFETILEDIKTFFDTRDASGAPSEEVVFLRITPYDGAWNLQATVDLVKLKLAGHLYKAAATPDFPTTPLSTLKGKVVATFTPAFINQINPNDGIFPYQDCGDAQGNVIPNVTGGLVVYDVYADENSFVNMKSDQSVKATRYARYGLSYLFLFSWTMTGHTGAILDLELLSRMANPQLAKDLRFLLASGTLPNIVHIDFADPYLCRAIIEMNF